MPETLEAEVIEIDGKPPPQDDTDPLPEGTRPWAIRFDRRWWPLWILLGGFALVFGLVFGALYLVYALTRSLLRMVFGGPNPR